MFGWFKKKAPPPPAATAEAVVTPVAADARRVSDLVWPADRPPAPPFDHLAWMRKHNMRYIVSLEDDKHVISNVAFQEVLGYLMLVQNQWTLYLTKYGVPFDVFDTAEEGADELLRVCRPKR